MKINKMLWIFGLILIFSVPGAFAQTGIFANPWVVFITNLLIVWTILFILVSFIPTQDNKVKVILWIATIVLAGVIVWNWGGRGDAYIWQAGWIAQYLGWAFIVNFIIIAGVIYFGLGFLGVNPTKPQGKIGMTLIAILFAGIVAYQLGDEFVWKHKNTQAFSDYLFAPEKIIDKGKVTDKDGREKIVDITRGGILTINKDDIYKSRLFIFIVSLVLFSWFFTGFLMPKDSKLSYLMAVIIAANLAKSGTTTTALITIAEAFAIIMVQKQIASQGGLFGGILGWTVTIVLVEFIFCAVFGYSGIAIMLANTFSWFSIPIPTSIGVKGITLTWWSPFAKLPIACDVILKTVGIAPPVDLGIPAPATTPPAVTTPPAAPSVPSWCHWTLKLMRLC